MSTSKNVRKTKAGWSSPFYDRSEKLHKRARQVKKGGGVRHGDAVVKLCTRLHAQAGVEDHKQLIIIRAAHRPRLDPSAVRVVKSFRLHPSTIARINAEADRTGESAGQVIDRLAAHLEVTSCLPRLDLANT